MSDQAAQTPLTDRLRDELVALQAKADTLRELVRDAVPLMGTQTYVYTQYSQQQRYWIRRAEQALGN